MSRPLLYFTTNSSAHLVGLASRPLYLSASPRRLYRGNVDFLHRHHRVERAFGGCGIGAHHRVGEGSGGDLPRQAPAVFAPAALAFLPAVADDCVPQAFAFSVSWVMRGFHRPAGAQLRLSDCPDAVVGIRRTPEGGGAVQTTALVMGRRAAEEGRFKRK